MKAHAFTYVNPKAYSTRKNASKETNFIEIVCSHDGHNLIYDYTLYV